MENPPGWGCAPGLHCDDRSDREDDSLSSQFTQKPHRTHLSQQLRPSLAQLHARTGQRHSIEGQAAQQCPSATMTIKSSRTAYSMRAAQNIKLSAPLSQVSTVCTVSRGAACESASTKRSVWIERCRPRPCTATMLTCCGVERRAEGDAWMS